MTHEEIREMLEKAPWSDEACEELGRAAPSIIRQLLDEREEMRKKIEEVKMPEWNGCCNERCKDRTCNLCKDYADVAERDKRHILALFDETI